MIWLLLACTAPVEPPPPAPPPPPLPGGVHEVRTADLDGWLDRGPLVLHLWASWVPSPSLDTLRAYASTPGSRVVAVHLGAHPIAPEDGLTHLVLLDPDALEHQEWTGELPLTLCVAASGRVRHTITGTPTRAQLEACARDAAR